MCLQNQSKPETCHSERSEESMTAKVAADSGMWILAAPRMKIPFEDTLLP
jgi:hypothetical protein